MAASGKESPPPSPGAQSKAPSTSEAPALDLLQCDLCQEDVTVDMDTHYRTAHGSLVEYCNTYMDASPTIRGRTVSPRIAHEFGVYAYTLLRHKDGGESAFNQVLDARSQMAHILRGRFPHDTLYIFGSTLTYGSWDGQADIDLTLVSPEQCAEGGAQIIANHEEEVAKVMRATRTLRDVGFQYEDLEPLRRTRVPIVKHTCSRRRSEQLDMRSRQLRVNYSKPLTVEDSKAVVEQLNLRGVSARFERNLHQMRLTCRTDTEAVELRSNMILVPAPKGVKVAHVYWESAHVKPIAYSIDFDISFRSFGIRNSWLLRHYLSQSHDARCGSSIVKMWSKCCGINNSKKGYFTTYAVNIMWIYYLLRKNEVKYADPTSITTTTWQQSPTYIPLLPDQMSEATYRRLGELLMGFFKFFAFEFSWSDDVVSISRATVTSKESLQWVQANENPHGAFRDRVWYRVAVEDPYEKNLNLGRHISPVKFHKVLAEFIAAYDRISRGLSSDLFVDFSCEHSADECRRVVVREMLCIDNLPLSKVLAEVKKVCPAALAAYETHNTTRSLFVHECKYTVQNKDGELYVCNPIAELEDAIEPVLRKIDTASARDAELGTKVTDRQQLTLLQRVAYLHESTLRLFGTKEARDRFAAHYNAAMLILLKNKTAALASIIAASLVSLEEAFLRRVIVEESLGTIDNEGNVTSTRAGTSLRDNSKGVSGRCDECHRVNTTVYPAADRTRDGGLYCNDCWIRYESVRK